MSSQAVIRAIVPPPQNSANQGVVGNTPNKAANGNNGSYTPPATSRKKGQCHCSTSGGPGGPGGSGGVGNNGNPGDAGINLILTFHTVEGTGVLTIDSSAGQGQQGGDGGAGGVGGEGGDAGQMDVEAMDNCLQGIKPTCTQPDGEIGAAGGTGGIGGGGFTGGIGGGGGDSGTVILQYTTNNGPPISADNFMVTGGLGGISGAKGIGGQGGKGGQNEMTKEAEEPTFAADGTKGTDGEVGTDGKVGTVRSDAIKIIHNGASQ